MGFLIYFLDYSLLTHRKYLSLYPSTLLNLFIGSNSFLCVEPLGFLPTRSCYPWMEVLLPSDVFFFFPSLLALARVSSAVVKRTAREASCPVPHPSAKLSGFYHRAWRCCGLFLRLMWFPLVLVYWEFLLWMGIGFCQMLVPHWDNCVAFVLGSAVVLCDVDGISYVQLSLHPDTNSTLSWCVQSFPGVEFCSLVFCWGVFINNHREYWSLVFSSYSIFVWF